MIKPLFASFLLASLAVTTVSAQLAEPSSTTETSGVGGQDVSVQAGQLATAITANIGDRADTASVADLEGFIMFVISQGDYAPEVVDAALVQLAGSATGNLAEAIANVQKSLKKSRAKGTGAIVPGGGAAGGGGGGSNGGFSAPGVGSGGGNANYAT